MSWINIYKDDLTTQEKRQVRQRLLADRQLNLSNRRLYEYMEGKQGRAIVMNRISSIITEFKKPSHDRVQPV